MIAQDKLKVINNPSRYLGGEMGQHIKNKNNVRIALLVPTIYEEAMSNPKVIDLYNNLNAKIGIWVERIFAPMPDYEYILRKENIPLTTIETESSLSEMQIIIVLIDDVMQITNALNILNLAKIPTINKRRNDKSPLVIFCGKAMLNPKPFLKFADCIICGDEEEIINQVLNEYAELQYKSKEEIIRQLEENEYIQSYINEDKEVKAYISNEYKYYSQDKCIVPSIYIKEGLNIIQLYRDNGIKQETLKANPIFEIKDKIQKTGEKKITIDAKNILDFEIIRDIIYKTQQEDEIKDNKISLINVNTTEENLWALEYTDGKANIKLEDDYNKENVLHLVKRIFKIGYSDINLQYTIGNQKENYEDLIALLELCEDILELYNKIYPNASKNQKISLQLIPFVPLINTKYEKYEVNSPEKLELKLRYIIDKNSNENINITVYNPYRPCIKTMILRGEKDLADVIYDAWKNGAKLDNIDSLFKKEPWEIALNKNKKSLKEYLKQIKNNEREIN